MRPAALIVEEVLLFWTVTAVTLVAVVGLRRTRRRVSRALWRWAVRRLHRFHDVHDLLVCDWTGSRRWMQFRRTSNSAYWARCCTAEPEQIAECGRLAVASTRPSLVQLAYR